MPGVWDRNQINVLPKGSQHSFRNIETAAAHLAFILAGRACDQGCSLEMTVDRIVSAYSSVPEKPEGELEVEMSWVSSL